MLADLRFAFRLLAKSPGFTAIAVLTLALGIGSATTAFSALNALLLRPLPLIQNQDRMLWINEAIPAKDVDRTDICYADFLDWRQRTQTLSAIWVYDTRTVILGGADAPERILGCGVTAGAFQAMGVRPVRGRDFLAAEDSPKAEHVALIGHDLWRRKFGGSDDVVGQSVKVNGQPTKIVGVMPPGWRYPETADLWVPLGYDAAGARRGNFEYAGHAMLKPGVTLAQAQAEFATISGALAKEFPATNDGLVATLRAVREEASSSIAQLTLLLFGAVVFVFLIACANVANLLLARASARTKEIAIRLALGAGRGRLLRQLLIESLLLSLLGGVGGLLVGWWGVDLMLAAIPVELPFWLRFDFDPRVFGFVLALAFLASLLFGLAPAWQASRPEVVDEIKDGGRSSGGGARSHRLRHALVVGEIALALVLLVGAGLMMRSFLALNRVAPGFDAHSVVTFRIGFPPAMTAGVKDEKPIFRGFFRDLLPRLAALPGVESVAATSALPGLGMGGFHYIIPEGQPEPKGFSEATFALFRQVTPDFFATLRIPLRAGRGFTATDDATHPSVVVVDEIFARKFFPNEDPIGKRFHTQGKPGEPPHWLEIVGVAGVVRRWVDRDDSPPTFYLAYEQDTANFMSVMLRVRGDPAAFLKTDGPLRTAVVAVNPDIPLYWNYTLQDAIDRSDSVWKRHFFGYLFTAFAAVALLLASIGIYGVMAYSVAQRTQEIGVRMALGAQPREIIGMVIRQGARLVGLGLALGFVAAYFTAQLLAGNLYGVSPHDPPTFALVPLLLAAVALVACWLPSRRATLIDPIIALRAE